jgi:hypothetical protein
MSRMASRTVSVSFPVLSVSGVKAAVEWARWGVAQEAHAHDFEYVFHRPLDLNTRWPWRGDCSWWCKWIAWRAGWLVDPTRRGWASGYGNSTDIFMGNRHVPLHKARPADIAVFGPNGDTHAAFIVQADLGGVLCSSMGEEGQPAYATVARMLEGIPEARGIVTICRPDSAARRPVFPPRVP